MSRKKKDWRDKRPYNKFIAAERWGRAAGDLRYVPLYMGGKPQIFDRRQKRWLSDAEVAALPSLREKYYSRA